MDDNDGYALFFRWRSKVDKSLKIALGSLGVSLVVPAVKFTAYLMTGSLALYSDALESIISVAYADSGDCGQGFQLNATMRSDRMRPPVPTKAAGVSLSA